MRLPIRLFAIYMVLAGTGLFAADATTAPSALSAPEIKGKLGTPVELFNGKDLAAWNWVPQGSKNDSVTIDMVWQVKDGVMHSAGKPGGWLVFEKPFSNYVITVEERHVTKGNGGLLVGIPDAKPKSGWPGLEIQTMTGSAGDLWNHNLLKMTGDPARTDAGGRHFKKLTDSQKPAGQWDVMEVVVDHGTLTFKVNGVVQNIVTDTADLSGKVGLQVEGAEMEFRKVTVTPIE